jgi:hypothetical protein
VRCCTYNMLVFVEGCCGDPARSGAPRRDFPIGVGVWGVPRDRQDGGCKIEFLFFLFTLLHRPVVPYASLWDSYEKLPVH